MERASIDDVAADHPGDGVVRHRLAGPLGTTGVAVNRYRVAPGAELPGGLHAHADQEEVFVVLAGEATFDVLAPTGDGVGETGDGVGETGDGVGETGDGGEAPGDGVGEAGDGVGEAGDEGEAPGDGGGEAGDGGGEAGDGGGEAGDGVGEAGDGGEATGEAGDGAAGTGADGGPEREARTVTVAAGEAVRFAPGEFQTGRNAARDGDDGDEGAADLVVLALGAPRDSDDVRVPVACPDCGRTDVRIDADAGGVDFVCPDCGSRRTALPCPDCGGDDLRVVPGEETVTEVVCRGCGAAFPEPPTTG